MHTNRRIRISIVLLWMASMGILLRFESYPHWFTRTIPGYRGLISDTLLARESWSRILIGGVPAGYSHTSLGINDETPGNLLEINNRVHLRIRLFGEIRRLFAQTLVALDRDFELYSFEASIAVGDITALASGRRIRSGVFEMTLRAGDTETVRTLEIPADSFMYSPVQELALRHLRPGGRLALKTFNPLTMQPSTVMIEAISRETITIGGVDTDTVRLRSVWQGIAFDSWVGPEGTVLRQETPVGWLIEVCTAEEALQAVTDSNSPPAILSTGGGSHLLNLLTGRPPP